MGEIGNIVKQEITENQESTEGKKRMLQVEISDTDDRQTVECMSPFGEDFGPTAGTSCVVLNLGENWKIAIAYDDGILPEVGEGEKDFYSISSNARSARIILKNNGEIVLNDGTDYAIQFTEMKSAFDEMKSDLNTLIQAFNAYAGQTVPLSIANMAPAKVDKVRL